jgi:hypothetical protein
MPNSFFSLSSYLNYENSFFGLRTYLRENADYNYDHCNPGNQIIMTICDSLTHPFIQGYFVKELIISVEGWMNCKTFNNAVSTSCDRMITFSTLEKGLGRKLFMEYYLVPSRRLPTGVEENHKNAGQIQSVHNSDTSEKCC